MIFPLYGLFTAYFSDLMWSRIPMPMLLLKKWSDAFRLSIIPTVSFKWRLFVKWIFMKIFHGITHHDDSIVTVGILRGQYRLFYDNAIMMAYSNKNIYLNWTSDLIVTPAINPIMFCCSIDAGKHLLSKTSCGSFIKESILHFFPNLDFNHVLQSKIMCRCTQDIADQIVDMIIVKAMDGLDAFLF
jgi:hypothetical protein